MSDPDTSKVEDTAGDAETVLRLPPRLFEGDTLYLPCRADGTPFEVSIERSELDDPALQVLIAAEMGGDGYEIDERRALVSRMGEGDLFVDVGAHRGIFTLHAATAIPGLRVIAIEPSAANVASLENAVRRNAVSDRVRIARAAAGAADGNIWLRHNTSMGHHVYTDGEAAGPGSATVAQLTLDTVVARAVGSRDAAQGRIWLKIDVEGREQDVLSGAAGLIGSGRVAGILWEYMVQDRPNPRLAEIEAQLTGAGYGTEIISGSNRLSLKRP